MFHSAAIKLTGWYLAIIMALAIGCSIAIYRVSSQDLTRNAYRQVTYFDNILAHNDIISFNQLRQQLLAEDLRHLKINLFLFNLVVLILGGGVSYAMARRTLAPIEEALESQKRFAADASHELRTPLTVLQTEIEVSLRDPKLTNTQAVALLKSNLEEVAKLKALSEALLTLASSNGQDGLDETVPVDKIVQEAIKRTVKVAKSKKITIENSISTGLSVRGNSGSLTQLVAVLLDNAVKYSPAGKTVSLQAAAKGNMVAIDVRDQGEGIKAQDLPRIFERFYRADSSRSKSKTEGYGLGLAIAKKIADLHQGHIEVKSALGQGSTFTVYLPVA